MSMPERMTPTMASRRSALRSLSGTAISTGLTGISGWTGAAEARGRASPSAVDPIRAFASSFDDFVEARGPLRVRFDRPLPKGLSGTLYRNGPARMQRGVTRYQHWFDGDGMMQSFRFDADAVVHRGRMIRTRRYEVEEKAGRFLRGGFGTAFTDALPVASPDDMNVANIAVLPVADELLALWEAGSAWRIDPDTLATRGRRVFSPDTDGLSFSAHPRVDPDGRIWNFGYLGGSGKLALYDIDRHGRLNRATLIDAPNAEMVHDFAVTRRFLVFVLMPITWASISHNGERSQASGAGPKGPGAAFMDRLGWNAAGQVDVLLIDKATLGVAHRFSLPPFFAFHLGNAWEDGETVRVEVVRAPAFDRLMQAIVGATTASPERVVLDQEPVSELRLDLRRRSARIETLPLRGAEFPRFDARFTGLPTSRLVLASRTRTMPEAVFGFNAIVSVDRKRARLQQWDYGERVIAEEHVFVPRPGSAEGIGWVVGTSYDWRVQRSRLSVFDAAQVDAGPIAQAELPYRLPLGLHGQFVTS